MVLATWTAVHDSIRIGGEHYETENVGMGRHRDACGNHADRRRGVCGGAAGVLAGTAGDGCGEWESTPAERWRGHRAAFYHSAGGGDIPAACRSAGGRPWLAQPGAGAASGR